ncbi:KRR1 small subunit processome component-like [Prunus dulcis]|uniref:KRR1 small subunit processome component-like n=1 Tax=Prunus dulcis TaxID=3755 RepID=UPI00148236C8|nr:KRR1 small subunit processome component-like [Prunus dulcis]
MTNKVNMEEIIAYNMKAKSYCPYDLSVLRSVFHHIHYNQGYQYFITFTTTKAKDSYAILDSRYLLRLLSAGVPPLRAVKVLNGMPCYLVYTGYVFDGFCQKFDIKRDKYVFRKKLLMSLPVQELEKLTCCNIYLCPENDMVAVMGPIRGMKLVRKIVEDCIVHNMPPAPRVRRLANYIQAIKGVEGLRL